MRKFKEFVIEKLILICGLASVFFVILIFLFLLKEGLAVFQTVNPFKFLFGRNWYPISEPAQLGNISFDTWFVVSYFRGGNYFCSYWCRLRGLYR